MFPVNVRFKDEKNSYKGKEYEMPRMGLAVINNFVLSEKSNEEKAIFSFCPSAETKKYYPFNFEVDLTYELVENKLVNNFKLKNIGTDTMYFALGGHPGFYCPFDNDMGRENYELVFPKDLTISRTDVQNSLVQKNQIPYLDNESRLSLADKRIPNGGMFLKNTLVREIGVAEKGKSAFVSLDLGDFPNVNIWTPPGMPFACIEPMLSHHDVQDSPLAIEEKEYLVKLAPEEIGDYSYTILIHGKS